MTKCKNNSCWFFWNHCLPLGYLWRRSAYPFFQQQGPVCIVHGHTKEGNIRWVWFLVTDLEQVLKDFGGTHSVDIAVHQQEHSWGDHLVKEVLLQIGEVHLCWLYQDALGNHSLQIQVWIYQNVNILCHWQRQENQVYVGVKHVSKVQSKFNQIYNSKQMLHIFIKFGYIWKSDLGSIFYITSILFWCSHWSKFVSPVVLNIKIAKGFFNHM